jgi:hypothetical protein
VDMMDKAIENYSVGKHKTVTADELEKTNVSTIASISERFICPECGEYVTFVRRYKYKSYFKHGNSNEATKKCDLRIEGQQNFSIYERMGLSLYLKKCIDNKFEFYVGFYNLDETLMNIAENQELKVSINPVNGDKKLSTLYFVNNNNFSTSSTTFKKIDFISTRYILQYSSTNAEQLLNKRWGKDFEGVLSGGALFTYSDNGGRKIKINDEITTDTDYFYLCKDGNVLDRCDGIEYMCCGEISLKTSFMSVLYNVYKIKFRAFNNVQFYKLINFCRDHLKISLIYKPSTLIAMWPPSIQIDNQISYINKKEALFILGSEETNARVFVHRDNITDELKGEKIDNNKYLMKIPVITGGIALNINEKYNSVFAFLTHYKGNIKIYNNSIYMKDIDDNPIHRGNNSKLPDKKTIKITAETKCDILHIKNNQVHKSYTIINEKGRNIDNIAFDDEIVFINGIEQTTLLKYIKNHMRSDQIFNDELLYLSLCQLGNPIMPPPIWIKKLLVLLKSNSKTFKVVRSFLLTNKMPVNAHKILNDLYKTMKVGVDCER